MDHDAHQHLIDAAGRTTAAIGEDEDGPMYALSRDDLRSIARLAAAVLAALAAGAIYFFNMPG